MNIKIKRKRLIILEMFGSTINGNWLKSIYKIDLKNKMLKLSSQKLISFETDEQSQSHAVVTD